MKHILITGKGSYIGTSLKQRLLLDSNEYDIQELDMMNYEWIKHDFTKYDIICHVAGIVHTKKASDKLYDSVNNQLAVQVADKAIKAGVKQFIFMSSGAVYSQNDVKHRSISIDEHSPCHPCTPYGISKLKAEKGIQKTAQGTHTKIAILRPPMVYGKGAKGNYNKLASIALKTPVFPNVDNQRSMVYIGNLVEFIKLVIDTESEGVFLPQNKEYANTSKLVRRIAELHNHRILLLNGFAWIIRIIGHLHDSVNKVFGSYVYARNSQEYFNGNYQVYSLDDSIELTEGKHI